MRRGPLIIYNKDNDYQSPLKLRVLYPLRMSILDTTLCDKVCQWFTPVSSTNKTDCHDITEILLKVVLNILNPQQKCEIFANQVRIGVVLH
jgi:hypothetical protein